MGVGREKESFSNDSKTGSDQKLDNSQAKRFTTARTLEEVH